jgi:acyl-CoA synthetase (AMP-forming)/AMP-acid ligase II
VTCTVVQEREQPQLFDVLSRAMLTGDPLAVLDPTWPRPFRALATGQVEDAVAAGQLGRGDLVIFSSGSTGRPRGVLRTVESWQASISSLSEITGITDQDRVWLPGPLWSSLFLYGAFHAAAVGAQLTFRGDAPAAATALYCVPSQLPGLLELAATGGLPLIGLAVVAGDHLSAPLRRQCEAAGWRVVEYYGAVELSFVAWRDCEGPFRAFPGVETEVRDGILWARSSYLARGYLAAGPDVPDGPLRLDPQGWATVGDLARAVPGGLEVLGRGSTAVTWGGHTVVVEEVERLLQALPGVHEVAVLGVPHRRLGQVLTAVVVGSAADVDLRAGLAGIPAPSRPLRWLHADALPRTSGGKLRRDELPELVARLSRR